MKTYKTKIQKALKKAGYYQGKIDGIFGKKTHRSILELIASAPKKPAAAKTIVITAGHGGRDSGAVNGHITESHIACEMRNMIAHYLREMGANVITDGESHTNAPLREAVKLISQGDVAIEIHTNAANSIYAKGVEVLAQKKDMEISKAMCKAVSDVLKTPVRGGNGGWKPENSGQHSRLAYVRNGGIILETFFISNPSELKKYQERKWLLAKAVAKSIYASV